MRGRTQLQRPVWIGQDLDALRDLGFRQTGPVHSRISLKSSVIKQQKTQIAVARRGNRDSRVDRRIIPRCFYWGLMRMKRLRPAAAIIALPGFAMAADLPSRRAPPVFIPPPIPVFTWTGLYIGGQAGYEFGSDADNAQAFNVLGQRAAYRNNGNGIVGGGHVGYNFSSQSLPGFGGALGTGAGGVVFGIEGDVDGSNTHRNGNVLVPGFLASTRQDIQGSIRGRVGLAVDRILFYATGGAAFGSIETSYDNRANGFGYDHYNHTRVGYTVGGGIEYAITPNWSLRAEYRYTDFGTFTDNLIYATAGTTAVRHHETDSRVVGGFSYRFDTILPIAAPVVARY